MLSSVSARSPLLQMPMRRHRHRWQLQRRRDQGLRRQDRPVDAEARGQRRRDRRAGRRRPRCPGAADHSRRLRKSSALSHCSAMPGNWNSSMYQDFSRCAQPAAAEGGRVADRQRGDRGDPVRRQRGRQPGDGGAPVVPDQVGPLDPQLVQQADHVADQAPAPRRRLRPWACWTRRTRAGRARSPGTRRRPAPESGAATGRRCPASRAAARRASPSPVSRTLQGDVVECR